MDREEQVAVLIDKDLDEIEEALKGVENSKDTLTHNLALNDARRTLNALRTKMRHTWPILDKTRETF